MPELQRALRAFGCSPIAGNKLTDHPAPGCVLLLFFESDAIDRKEDRKHAAATPRSFPCCVGASFHIVLEVCQTEGVCDDGNHRRPSVNVTKGHSGQVGGRDSLVQAGEFRMCHGCTIGRCCARSEIWRIKSQQIDRSASYEQALSANSYLREGVRAVHNPQ